MTVSVNQYLYWDYAGDRGKTNKGVKIQIDTKLIKQN
jgi:hypothetical protein